MHLVMTVVNVISGQVTLAARLRGQVPRILLKVIYTSAGHLSTALGEHGNRQL